MNAHITNATVHLDGDPSDIQVHNLAGPYPVLQVGTALTVHLGQADPGFLYALAGALTQAADIRNLKAVAA